MENVKEIPYLYVKNDSLVRSEKKISEEVERTKGSGARKLVSNLRHSYFGLSSVKV